MKNPIIILVIFFSISLSIYGQDVSSAINELPCDDSSYYLQTDYPIRLTNDRDSLQKTMTKEILLYPEDASLEDEYIYRVAVDCNGTATSVDLTRSSGSNKLKKRIQNYILSSCTWIPAVHQDMRVNSQITVVVKVKEGKCELSEVQQKSLPTIYIPENSKKKKRRK